MELIFWEEQWVSRSLNQNTAEVAAVAVIEVHLVEEETVSLAAAVVVKEVVEIAAVEVVVVVDITVSMRIEEILVAGGIK
jgi:hypothetical protein